MLVKTKLVNMIYVYFEPSVDKVLLLGHAILHIYALVHFFKINSWEKIFLMQKMT